MGQNVLMVGGVVHGKTWVVQTPLMEALKVVRPSAEGFSWSDGWAETGPGFEYDIYIREFFSFGHNVLAIYRHSEVSQQAATEMLFNLILNDTGKAVLLR